MCYKDFLVKLLDKLATKGLFCKAIFATIFSAIKVYIDLVSNSKILPPNFVVMISQIISVYSGQKFNWSADDI